MRFKDGAGTAWEARFSLPLTLNSIAEILEDFKMANCTKSKGKNRVYLCILPGARALQIFFFFHFSIIIISFFFKKIKSEIPGQNPVNFLTGL